MPFTFTPAGIADVIIIEPRVFPDERGFFMETYKHSEFAAQGIREIFVQGNQSRSARGILRGLHFQKQPKAQGKLVRAITGTIFDVAVDLRPDSKTFKDWIGVELSADNRSLLYLPHDCAHGYQSLEDDSEVFYMVSGVYVAESGRGFRWNDPAFGIEWPEINPLILNERDRQYPDFKL